MGVIIVDDERVNTTKSQRRRMTCIRKSHEGASEIPKKRGIDPTNHRPQGQGEGRVMGDL